MLNRVAVWRERMRTGLWPVPLAMLLGGVALYNIALGVDGMIGNEQVLRAWWLHRGNGDDARNLMSTLVTAIITMSSVVFSITIVALSLAANQFGSRLVRTYVSDIRTKVALGVFTMTVVYCLLALGTLEKEMVAAQVPHIAVTLGLALGLGCILTLLLFLHRVARSIVADDVIRHVAGDLEKSIAGLPPLETRKPEGPSDEMLPKGFHDHAVMLRSSEEGYVQAVDYERLVALAEKHDVHFRLEFKPGAFMCKDGWLGALGPAEAVTPELAAAVQESILIGAERTPTQDLEFSIRHLVDIALRALSPGINDANTALVVIDRLRGALSRLMGKSLPPAVFRDGSGVIRVVGKRNGYGDVLDAALHQIRQAGAIHPAVMIGLLGAIGRIAEHVVLPEQRQALLHHTRMIAAAGTRDLQEPSDRADIEAAHSMTERKLTEVLHGRRPVVRSSG